MEIPAVVIIIKLIFSYQPNVLNSFYDDVLLVPEEQSTKKKIKHLNEKQITQLYTYLIPPVIFIRLIV